MLRETFKAGAAEIANERTEFDAASRDRLAQNVES